MGGGRAGRAASPARDAVLKSAIGLVENLKRLRRITAAFTDGGCTGATLQASEYRLKSGGMNNLRKFLLQDVSDMRISPPVVTAQVNISVIVNGQFQVFWTGASYRLPYGLRKLDSAVQADFPDYPIDARMLRHEPLEVRTIR